jgi:hypothetical protein
MGTTVIIKSTLSKVIWPFHHTLLITSSDRFS